MTATNPFVLAPEEYVRDINFLKHYIEDCAFYVHIESGFDYQTCYDYIKRNIKPDGKFPLRDPRIRYLERIDFGDRVLKEGTLMQFLQQAIVNEDLIAPNLTTYINAHKKPSILSEFIDENIQIRSKAKKEMFAARMANQVELAVFKYCEQLNAKTSNNSVSGAHVSSSTPLYNKTSHSTLTSNCRSTSGFGNANNEKMLSGNRHYHSPAIVLNNIISIAQRSDLQKIEEVMTEYGLHYPTAEEAMDCIRNSTDLYWRSEEAMKRYYSLLSKMTPLMRAAFVYVGDLFQLAKYNPDMVRTFIKALASPVHKEYDNPSKVMHSHREEYSALAAQLWAGKFKGIDWKKLKSTPAKGKENDPEELENVKKDIGMLNHIAGSVENIYDIIQSYSNFIEAFFVTKNVPASLAYFPQSIRKSALTSDTDSTIFTVQDWVRWMTGRLVVDEESNRIAATMIFFAAETITHILARMSANFGIETKRIHQVAMKNEFKFDVFVPTQVGKHYFAFISAQEGNILIEYDLEVKGVHLKSSNVPKHVMKRAVKMMEEIMETAARGDLINLRGYLKEVADLEREIRESIMRGEPTYLRYGEIKSADSYKADASRSNYQHYTFWQECFEASYGNGVGIAPPYGCYKVSVDLGNQNAIRHWIENIENSAIRESLKNWNARCNKQGMSTFWLPIQVIQEHGIPKEIVPILELRRSVLDITMVFYLILETLGYYCVNDSINHLVSDFY